MMSNKTAHHYLLTLERNRDSSSMRKVAIKCVFGMDENTRWIMKIYAKIDNSWRCAKTVMIPDGIFHRDNEERFFIEWAKDYWNGKDGNFNLKGLKVLDF